MASFNFHETHGTYYPKRATSADTVQGQILELCSYLLNERFPSISIDPDFVTSKINITCELPLVKSHENGVICIATTDSYRNTIIVDAKE